MTFICNKKPTHLLGCFSSRLLGFCIKLKKSFFWANKSKVVCASGKMDSCLS